jgi:transposase
LRRKLGGHNRFYAQLICAGQPYRKDKHPLGHGVVGVDIGPSTIARVSATEAKLEHFCDELEDKHKILRRLQRKLDRSRRANNPHNYNADGTCKKGRLEWGKSKVYRTAQSHLAELHRMGRWLTAY